MTDPTMEDIIKESQLALWQDYCDMKMRLEAANDEIERLREKCDKQAMILRRLTPDKFPDTFFIHGHLGTKDQNGLPEKLLVVPAYGCDWSQIYVKTDKTTGPEW